MNEENVTGKLAGGMVEYRLSFEVMPRDVETLPDGTTILRNASFTWKGRRQRRNITIAPRPASKVRP